MSARKESTGTALPVVVVGYGPVGQVIAAALGLRGHSVVVLEQHDSRYGLPRAAHLDGEAMRILQSIGVARNVADESWRQSTYDFLSSDGRLLHRIDFDHADPSGWSAGYFCHGPTIETLVDRRVQEVDAVTVRMGERLVDLHFDDDRVHVLLQSGEHIDASWVVGADGANSAVARISGIDTDDLGYSAEWLVLDVRPHDPELRIDMPEAAQICDSVRPVSLFRRLGRDHLRIEFPVLAGEMWSTEAVWSTLDAWNLNESNSDLVRKAIYTFKSELATSFRYDRALLVGDAAHLMPPFLGQGLCSGLRDVAALEWRLDRVLRGESESSLLDSYGEERRPHVRGLIDASTSIGRIIGADLPSGDIASALSALPAAPAALAHGLLDPQRRPGAGTIAPQATVRALGKLGPSDDVVSGVWLLLLRNAPPDGLGESFTGLNVWVLHLSGQGPAHLDDVDGTLTRWLDALGAAAVLIRPDHYVHTVLATADELPAVFNTVADQLVTSGGRR